MHGRIGKQVADQDILKILDPVKSCSSVQNFIDIYLRLPGLPTNGQLAESDCIRILIEVDHLQDTPSPYLQIKGVNKEAVTAAGSTLNWMVHTQLRVICRSFLKDYQQCKEVTVEFMLNKLQGCRNLSNLYNLREAAQLQNPLQVGTLLL
ncbi:P-LOOP CONTAINING NUCLEOSIDE TRIPHOSPHATE HYDROLASES SUPERFAMILY PROTEIN [Salix purpurea]|uniref:p-LOOP CONTAINING NUCLEOSIDE TRIPHOSPHATE HYDROLASES SUPERFAMILY PROTEIN n=1 Tax=Salix purpurea TaxID=77065 RepID=A0A9Q0TW77_SALPP|nr:P-LOOP CONTAINING NUCLEOSIDE TRIPHOSPHATE HYDROLASES SUPERFAMILY PROTEIN [Salix purpurea]